jgi:DNA polymerase-3 subunit gamma/tau
MEDASWLVADGEVKVQTEVSPRLLPIVMNPEAEKIAKATIRTAGVMKLTLLPGAPAGMATKKPKVAKAGSAQARALEHPMVQAAQRLFDAEIQTVIDLSGKD